MTPKDKAKELVIKYINIDYGNVDFYDLDLDYLTDIMRYDPREFAIIAVNEVINANPYSNPFNTEIYSTMNYWQEVKNEINQL